MKRKGLSNLQKAATERHAQTARTFTEIAREAGVTVNRVYAYLTRHRPDLASRIRRRRTIAASSRERLEDLERAFRAGESRSGVARRWGVSRNTVYQLLPAHAPALARRWPRGKPARPATEARLAKLDALVPSKTTKAEAREVLGLSPAQFSQLLRHHRPKVAFRKPDPKPEFKPRDPKGLRRLLALVDGEKTSPELALELGWTRKRVAYLLSIHAPGRLRVTPRQAQAAAKAKERRDRELAAMEGLAAEGAAWQDAARRVGISKSRARHLSRFRSRVGV